MWRRFERPSGVRRVMMSDCNEHLSRSVGWLLDQLSSTTDTLSMEIIMYDNGTVGCKSHDDVRQETPLF